MKTIYIILIVAVIIVGGGAALYYTGKRKGAGTPPQLVVPQDNNGNNIAPVVISQTAIALYDDMNGINFLGMHDANLYEAVNLFSNTDLVNLYNDFNTRYFSESGYTLVQWIDGEYYANTDFAAAINSRLKSLGAT